MGLIDKIAAELIEDAALGVLKTATDVASTAINATAKAAEAVSDATRNAISKVEDTVDIVQRKNAVRFLKRGKTHTHLVIFQDYNRRAASYSVFDETQNIKYKVIGASLAVKHMIQIYDDEDNVIAQIKEKILSVRNPLSFEFAPTDFYLEINGQCIGMIKTSTTALKRNVSLGFYGWQFDGDLFAANYRVLAEDGETQIMKVSNRRKVNGDSYYLDISNPDNELICLMIAITVDLAYESKKQMANRSDRQFK